MLRRPLASKVWVERPRNFNYHLLPQPTTLYHIKLVGGGKRCQGKILNYKILDFYYFNIQYIVVIRELQLRGK